MQAKILFFSQALPALPVTHIFDLCIILDFDISIWVLVLRLCLNLAKSFWPPSIKDRLICLPAWLKFLLRFLPCISKTAITFPWAFTNAAGQHAAVGVTDPRTVLGPLSPSSVMPSTSCLSSPGWLLPGILDTQHLAGIWSLLPNRQQGSPSAFFFYLPSYHSSYWGMGALSSICQAPTVLLPNRITLSMMLPKKENHPRLYVPFHKSCLFTILQEIFQKFILKQLCPAWDKMLRTQKMLFYYFNLENLDRHFPLG